LEEEGKGDEGGEVTNPESSTWLPPPYEVKVEVLATTGLG